MCLPWAVVPSRERKEKKVLRAKLVRSELEAVLGVQNGEVEVAYMNTSLPQEDDEVIDPDDRVSFFGTPTAMEALFTTRIFASSHVIQVEKIGWTVEVAEAALLKAGFNLL